MLRRRQDSSLPAEIQWELLLSLAYELPGFSIAGSLEPAYDIGGDTFDYAVRDVVENLLDLARHRLVRQGDHQHPQTLGADCHRHVDDPRRAGAVAVGLLAAHRSLLPVGQAGRAAGHVVPSRSVPFVCTTVGDRLQGGLAVVCQQQLA
ncbi:MAG: hypothetical protein M3228_14650 [Actinomycetota bacterium]|nr:hypothetical protein [Actinomycetota bacterium]